MNENYEDFSELKQLLKEQEPDFLEEAKARINRRQTYVCPHCGNGSGVSGTGIEYDERHERWKCFACGESMDVIDLAMAANCMDFMEAVNWLCDYYGIDYCNQCQNKSKSKDTVRLTYKPYTDEVSQAEFISEAEKNNNYTYLQWRGISPETQRRFHVGYVEEWVHPKAPVGVTPTARVIIPTSDYSYLARSVKKDSELTETEKPYVKSKVGQVHIFNFEAMDDTDKDYAFVTEGEIDAMSIEECEHPAIGLGSVGNARRFVDECYKKGIFKDTIFLFTDTDKAGKNITRYLRRELIENYICNKVVVVKYPDDTNFKDPNEFLMCNREWFKQWLDEVVRGGHYSHEVGVSDEEVSMLELLKKKYKGMNENEIIRQLIIKEYFDYKKASGE